jgi:hypothetical protein
MSEHAAGHHRHVHDARTLGQLRDVDLSTPVVLVFGRQFFINAWKQAKHRSANMDTLVALSTGVAYASASSTPLYPSFWTSRGLMPHVYFEAAAVVITFILLGKFLEERAKAGTSSAIKKLMGLRPKHRAARGERQTSEVPIAEVNVDDILVVRPGESIAVDGEVIGGESYVDESMISGEPIPVAKARGAQVLAGTINQKGSLRMKAQKVGAGHLAGADRAHRAGSAGQQGTRAEAGGQGRGGVRSHRHRHRHAERHRVVDPSVANMRSRRGLLAHGHRAGDRLPLRAWGWPHPPPSWPAWARAPRTAS